MNIDWFHASPEAGLASDIDIFLRRRQEFSRKPVSKLKIENRAIMDSALGEIRIGRTG